ncbi:MAG: hypothetical protein PHP65_02465 [Bacilli bacterium]|nr:hypothetical protein [Bacilli bacterium]
MDKSLPYARLYFRKSLPYTLKKFFFFEDKYKRDDFLVYSILIQLFGYILIFVSFALFLYAIISQDNNIIFVSAVASFSLCVFGTIQIILEMILEFIEEIKKDRIGDDF